MDSGSMAALQMSFDYAKKVGELIPSASQQTLKSPQNSQAPSQQPLADFASMINKQNEQTLKFAAMDAQVGGQLDVYA